jgi:hypothetical protein
VGSVDIPNGRQPISTARLRDAIVDNLGAEVLEAASGHQAEAVVAEATRALVELSRLATLDAGSTPARLAPEVPVSVFVLARSEPDGLRRSLRCLLAQESSRTVEILVVAAGAAVEPARQVVAEFTNVALLSQPASAAARALSDRVEQSDGEIIVTVMEGAELPREWLERLLSPFGRPDVMAVTGPVVRSPAGSGSEQFDTPRESASLTEPFEADRDWFESFHRKAVPTWKLGTVANAAYRRSVFTAAETARLDEGLGTAAASEAATRYRFYQILKAGYRVVHEPLAYIRLEEPHRLSDPGRLRYNRAKEDTAYHLMTLLRDRDLRALLHLLVHAPRWHWRGFTARVRREQDAPWSLLLLEIAGGLAAPWALWGPRRAGR